MTKVSKKQKQLFFLLFLDEKKQKSTGRTELAKNPKLTLKCFNSSHTPKTFLNALTADFLNANYVMSEILRPSTSSGRTGEAS
jgi:hypothetical protein